MIVCVAATGKDLNAPVEGKFSECPSFIFYDTEKKAVSETPDNPAVLQPREGERQAADFVVEKGAEAVLAAAVGIHSFDRLSEEEITVFTVESGDAQRALSLFASGELPRTKRPVGGLRPEMEGLARPPSTEESADSAMEHNMGGGKGHGFGDAPLNEAEPEKAGDDPDVNPPTGEPLPHQGAPDEGRTQKS